MENLKTVLITGASSGIGAALAEQYAVAGMMLLLTGRDQERLDVVAELCRSKGADVEVCTTPVTLRDEFGAQIQVWDDLYSIDLVVANAGMSGGNRVGVFHDIMDVNVNGVFNTVQPLIPRMQKRGRGQIVLVSSLAGLRGMPSAPAYSVSKNAVRAYAEALRPLLQVDGIAVNVVYPGFVRTPLTAVNKFPMPFLMQPIEAAVKIKKGIEKNKAVIAFPWMLYWSISLIRFLPRCLGDWILKHAPKKA